MKITKITLIVILVFASFLICTKYYALSDKRLMEYHWKAYNQNCNHGGKTINKEDLNKIGKEWKLTYRWLDNSVFLRIKNSNCIYISK